MLINYSDEIAIVASSLLVNYRRANRRPSVFQHDQILNKIRMFQLVKILISTTHRRFETDHRQSHAPTPSVTDSQPVKFSCYILLLFTKYLVFCTLVNGAPPRAFLVWPVAATHLFSLSKVLCAAYGSVYLIILNENVNSLYTRWFKYDRD